MLFWKCYFSQVSKEARDLAFENRSLRQENSSLEDQVMALNRTVQDGAYSKVGFSLRLEG